eukprot:COSAG06_NODE_1278_length_10031_cov_105.662002_10_plen_176_part_00
MDVFACVFQWPQHYTVTGCSDESHCGVFTRVLASCASGSHCPGGDYANGNTDPTLCDNAAVYQEGGPDGPVLFRYYYSDRIYSSSGTKWLVGPSDRLDACGWSGSTPTSGYSRASYGYGPYLHSALNPGRPGGAPTAPGYSAGGGWTDHDNSNARGTITVTAGDGSAIGGGGGGH